MPPLPCALGFGARALRPAIRQCPWPLPRSPGQIPLSPTAWSVGAGGCRWHLPTCPQMFWSLTFPLFYRRAKRSNPACVRLWDGSCRSRFQAGAKDFLRCRQWGAWWLCPGVWQQEQSPGICLCHDGCGGHPRSQPLPFHHRLTQKSHHY